MRWRFECKQCEHTGKRRRWRWLADIDFLRHLARASFDDTWNEREQTHSLAAYRLRFEKQL